MTRDLITSGPATGVDVMANLNGHIERLWNAASLPLTGVGGTANALTATVSPPLLAGLVLGMKFSLTVPADNTGGVTLSINGAAPVPVVGGDGVGLFGGALRAGARILLEWDGAAMRVIAGGRDGDGAAGPQVLFFTASATWAVPTGYDDDHMVLVEAWGGGGGGSGASNGGPGGGGGYMRREFRYADLPSSITIVVGAGGAVGAAGGNSTFGTLMTAWGGGAGGPIAGGGGGGAGGFGGNAGYNVPGNPGYLGGGPLIVKAGDGTSVYQSADAQNIYGGGAGYNGTPGGGKAVFGGGGGGGAGAPGGSSIWGGNGGAEGVAGSVRGGGGGRNAAGGNGQVRVWL